MSSTQQQREDRLWSPIELAKHLGIPVATLYAWRYRGEGPPALRIGRHLRYRPADIEAWLLECDVAATDSSYRTKSRASGPSRSSLTG
jgi:predicted DNA-binding transcriptional regulator AlpA